jgi:hypothetical protein
VQRRWKKAQQCHARDNHVSLIVDTDIKWARKPYGCCMRFQMISLLPLGGMCWLTNFTTQAIFQARQWHIISDWSCPSQDFDMCKHNYTSTNQLLCCSASCTPTLHYRKWPFLWRKTKPHYCDCEIERITMNRSGNIWWPDCYIQYISPSFREHTPVLILPKHLPTTWPKRCLYWTVSRRTYPSWTGIPTR